MQYTDGMNIDEKSRVLQCPRCHNDEFSDEVRFCRICGLSLFNTCEGYEEYDGYNNRETVYHNNPGNARFCEVCGSKTRFFLEKILKPWDEVKITIEKNNNITPFEPVVTPTVQADSQGSARPLLVDEAVDDDDLPF